MVHVIVALHFIITMYMVSIRFMDLLFISRLKAQRLLKVHSECKEQLPGSDSGVTPAKIGITTVKPPDNHWAESEAKNKIEYESESESKLFKIL
jgi:hypothetical protein